ncbi:hypothetical protein NEUTE1DRAFT_121495 [Neurospora tetrasperma FGSC 2508]|uniref:Uncharacterized protein n=1 Tax=Neurospora tetrasperma (strain FGSC 2508 / ATCC MYA-4615 / P0657) TaxID=510951 RepID=F8MI94_NEUT8|nr:uncharacterized protein NEUTE1DRAFT_121495 [Neurospora tetrasperma FGSC 2508]EGO59748.1 hypothetical protein NEUTE1DRAFT_121495 [Neurospora tetrasperma FGSC 2508]EGZ73891.1 hypothetical protein NEUTE2DRAFT_108950 [Neurospora tetrasperma FGSC 2509]
MSSPNSIATAILANTGQSRNDYYGGGLGLETPLTGRSLLSVSIGNTTESMASSIVSPRTRGRWDRRISDVESASMYSPTAAAAPPAPPSSSWLTDDDDEASVRSGGLDTRPFPSFGPSSSIAPDSSFYSQIGRFQGVRNSVSLPQPWRRRKESTTTGSYTTSTDSDDEDEDDEDEDASTISGSRHEGQQEQEQEQDAAATSAAVDLFSQHQFIMPKPDETTPLIAADEENNLCFGGGGYDEASACVK